MSGSSIVKGNYLFQNSKTRAYIRRWVAGLIMLDAIYRFFSGTKPIDKAMFVIDLLILLLIFGEIIVPLLLWARRRGKIAKIGEFTIKGQHIQKDAPVGQADQTKKDDWLRSASTWESEVTTYLTKFPTARAVFLQDLSSAMMSVSYNRVTPDIRNEFERLSTRLLNLNSVLEKPEVYF
jgi:hypothetical protein